MDDQDAVNRWLAPAAGGGRGADQPSFDAPTDGDDDPYAPTARYIYDNRGGAAKGQTPVGNGGGVGETAAGWGAGSLEPAGGAAPFAGTAGTWGPRSGAGGVAPDDGQPGYGQPAYGQGGSSPYGPYYGPIGGSGLPQVAATPGQLAAPGAPDPTGGYSGFIYVPYAPFPPGTPPAPSAEEAMWQGIMSLAEPFAPLTTLGLFASALIVVLGAFFFGLAVNEGDWASGVHDAGVAGIALAAAYVIGMAVRLVIGRRAITALLLALVAAVLLGATGSGALVLSDPLHLVQARAQEAAHDYGGAATEYQLAGRSHDVARVLDEWGETLVKDQVYDAAAQKFGIVITTYSSYPVEFHRAWSDLLSAYATWLGSATAASQLPYDGIVLDLAGYVHDPGCDTACQGTLLGLEARAHYQEGVMLAGQQDYPNAIVQFEDVATHFAHSAFAPRAHRAAASAYYAYGEAQMRGNPCSDAVPTFKTLASHYADTPEGAKARAALRAAVKVYGHVLAPPSPHMTIYLSRGVSLPSYFSDDYGAALGSDGWYTFAHVAPGTYYWSAGIPGVGQIPEVNLATGAPYPLAVAPLCPDQLNSCAFDQGYCI